MRPSLALATAIAFVAGPALAHPGDHSHVTLAHLLEPDRLALIAAGVVAAGLGVAGMLRRTPR